jgi:adenine-specific DNA-methyltransferase
LLHALVARPELHGTVFEALNKIAPKALIEQGRVYGGGLHKLEPRELSALPALELHSAFRA